MPHLRQYPCSMSVFCEAAELPSNLKTVTKMENKTGLEKLLDSLVHQSNGCGQSSERYILSGIIDYTKKLIEEEKEDSKKYSGSQVAAMMKSSYRAGKKEIKCQCDNEIKTGQTSVMCCNICGLPDEKFWTI